MSNSNIPILQSFAAFQKVFYEGAVCGKKQAAPAVGGTSHVKKLKCKKGNAFTIEALLGALLFVLFIGSIVVYANQFKENSWVIPDELLADDVLIVLDKTGTLSTMNSTLIEQEIDLILENRTNYRLELRTYNYSSGAFQNISETSIGSVLDNESELAVAERGFFSTSNDIISNYTIARLYIWK